ncbi:hypothetical protein M3Y94_00094600 [Aphelenchoides besseyi]|nr:hypothetical protein M3Y94_00094600 [Aphelenchoides besseyi]
METGAYVIFFSLIIADIYPLFNQCLVICFVEPYRLAAVQFLRIHWLFGVEKETQWETAYVLDYRLEQYLSKHVHADRLFR